MKSVPARSAGLALIILALTVTAALMIMQSRTAGDEGESASGGFATAPVRVRSLSEAGQARFFSIFIYDEAGHMSSIMVSPGTDEFDSIAEAVEKSRPVEGVAADDSFSILLVVSFGRNDTMDVSYSPGRNMLIYGEQAWQPAADLAPLITQVQQKFNY